MTASNKYPQTPDGRYFVVKGRLWRLSNPDLATDEREAAVKNLMDARRELRGRPQSEAAAEARKRVHEAKVALGERGPVWWTDGAPDYNQHLAQNTPYAEWFARVGDGASGKTG